MKPGNLPDAFQSNVPPSTMMPPIEVPWPPMNLVASGRRCRRRARSAGTRYGVGKVLSMISGTPASCAIVGDRLDVEGQQIGVADRLGVDRLRLGRDRRRDAFRRSARRT